jgi:hypothetical protein
MDITTKDVGGSLTNGRTVSVGGRAHGSRRCSNKCEPSRSRVRVGAESESDPATKKLEPIRFGPSSEGMWAVGVWQRHYLVAQACGIHTTPTSITR